MISHTKIDFKKYNADGIGSPSTTFPRVDFAMLNQPWADKSTTPMVLVHVHRFPNKQNHTRNPPKRNQRSTHNLPKRRQPSMRNPSKRNRRGGACVPARTSAQRRFHTKYTRIVRGELNDGCAPAGRLGRAHRHRPYQTPPNHAVCHYLITLYIR